MVHRTAELPPLNEIYEERIPVFTSISHHVRGEVRQLLTDTLDSIVHSRTIAESERAWARLFLLPFLHPVERRIRRCERRRAE